MNVKSIAKIFSWVCVIIAGALFWRVWRDGFGFWTSNPIRYDITGQVGDFIGGVIGTIISAAGFYFLYLTFHEQRNAFQKERFESKFFDLIKVHRDNVAEMRYSRIDDDSSEDVEGRKVFRLILLEFQECLKEVRNYMEVKDATVYLTEKYHKKIRKIADAVNNEINLYELITIDVAFCVVFYGLSEEGEVVLREIFLRRYDHKFHRRLIKYLQMKPRRQDVDEYEKWKEFKALSMARRLAIFNELYDKRSANLMTGLSADANYFGTTSRGIKYYGGHQHRLGHYFRHLFQSYKFLNNQKDLDDDEKYFYGKLFRAQLSTYEQAILFIDSLSCLGFKWELTPEIDIEKDASSHERQEKLKANRLITKYSLIKNLPGNRILDIKFKTYYPKVKYESDDLMALRY